MSKLGNEVVEHKTFSLKNIVNAQFRANPNFQLIAFDRLSERDKRGFSDLKRDTDFYGVLLPRNSMRQSPKAVDQETALLFFTLQEPGLLPAYVLTKFGEQINQAIAELVLDDVLEIAENDTGKFVSGASAYELIYEQLAAGPGRDRIAQLSREALQYAQALDIDDSNLLSSRLYFYNTIPISPHWWSQLGTFESSINFLEINDDGRQRAMLDRHWISSKRSNKNEKGWLFWRSRYLVSDLYDRELLLGYKLYISPLPEDLKAVWPIVLSILTELRVRSFKIGADVYGLLRPDKIVVYFPNFELLAKAASRLQQELAGSPAQGTPFTAGIDPDGLLSWGMDPVSELQLPTNTHGKESWRSWITKRLATALQASKQNAADIPAWQFALQRLRLDGIDIDTWTPLQSMWKAKSGV